MRGDRLEDRFGANPSHTYDFVRAPGLPMKVTCRAMVTTETTYVCCNERHGSIRVNPQIARGWAEQSDRETAECASYVERAGIHAHEGVCRSEERRRLHHIELIGPINRTRDRL